MTVDVIRVSMPLLELVLIAGVTFVVGVAAGLWLRGR